MGNYCENRFVFGYQDKREIDLISVIDNKKQAK